MKIDKDNSSLTNEIVKRQYETLMHSGLPFLQIFPEMIQEPNVAETFKTRVKGRNHDFYRDASIQEFRENLFLYCGISLNILSSLARPRRLFGLCYSIG